MCGQADMPDFDGVFPSLFVHGLQAQIQKRPKLPGHI
jgi:hypothetical protein